MTTETIPTRLFDQAQRRPDAPAYYTRGARGWEPTSWRAYSSQVRRAAKALIALGFQPGDNVCILGFNRPEWVIFDVAAMAMRQLLADHARRQKAAKRGGGLGKVTLEQAETPSWTRMDVDLVALEEALTKLANLDARQARIVELRFLAGLTVDDTAEVLGVSPRTVKLDWQMARAWLRRELG